MTKYEEEEDELSFNPITPKDLETQTNKNIRDFADLLDTLSTLHDKKKSLWKQIYENAVLDRRNAYIMYSDLYTKVHNSAAEHAIHGQTLAKYMERMNKSNEQLIKLAEILDEAVTVDEEDMTNEDAFYETMEAESKKKK